MRVYIDADGVIVATHEDAVRVPLSAYPSAANLVFVPDGLALTPAQYLPDAEGNMGGTVERPQLPEGYLKASGLGSPPSVVKLGLQRALRQMGHGDALRSALAAADDDDQDDWAAAQTIARADPLVARLGTALKLKPAKMDEAFRLADELVPA